MTVGLILDLDGTLIHSEEAICTALAHALEAVNHPIPSRETLKGTIGYPLHSVFHPQLGVPAKDADAAVAAYKQTWTDGIRNMCGLYPGTESSLRKLLSRTYTLAVATAKIHPGCINAVKRHALHDYFNDRVFGVLPGDKPGKSAVVSRAHASLKEAGCQHVAMVGDALSDARAAHELGLPFIWCRYGYGPSNLPQQCPVHSVIDSIDTLAKAVRTEVFP